MTGFLQVYVYMCYFAVLVGLNSIFMKNQTFMNVNQNITPIFTCFDTLTLAKFLNDSNKLLWCCFDSFALCIWCFIHLQRNTLWPSVVLFVCIVCLIFVLLSVSVCFLWLV